MALLAIEEARAVLYRQQLAARASAQAQRCALLQGSTVARQALAENWRPITDPQPDVPDICDPCEAQHG